MKMTHAWSNKLTVSARDGYCFAITALVAVGAGCASGPDIHSRSDTAQPPSMSRTFAVIPVATTSNLPPETAKEISAAAATGARTALRAHGYVETNQENADLVFYLHGKSMATTRMTDWNLEPAPRRFGTSTAEVQATANGRIFVETYDNHSKRQVWMGWLNCGCKGVDPERIQREIEHILETFPPRVQSYSRLD